MTVPADRDGKDQQIQAVRAHLARLLERRGERRDRHAQRIYEQTLNYTHGRLSRLQAERDALG